MAVKKMISNSYKQQLFDGGNVGNYLITFQMKTKYLENKRQMLELYLDFLKI